LPATAYHRRVSWLPVLAVAAVAFALALIPTRRLSLAGWRPTWLAAYFVALLALAVLAVELRAGLRVLVPILIVLYVAPFVGAPEVVARTIARLGAGRGGRGAGTVVEGTARPADEPSTATADGSAPPGEDPETPPDSDGDAARP
jgi:hypothetical protein